MGRALGSSVGLGPVGVGCSIGRAPRVQSPPPPARSGPSSGAIRPSRERPRLSASLHAQELLQGREAGEPARLRDLRWTGPGCARRAPPPGRGERVAVRGAPLARVPRPACRAGLRREPVARVARRRVPHRPPRPGDRSASCPVGLRAAGPGAAGVLFLGLPAPGGRGVLRPRRAPRDGHRPVAGALGGGSGPPSQPPDDAAMVPRGAVAPRPLTRSVIAGADAPTTVRPRGAHRLRWARRPPEAPV